MKTKALICIVFLAVLLTVTSSFARQGIVCTQGNGVNDLSIGIAQLKENSGDVVFYLAGDSQQDVSLELPADMNGLSSVTIGSLFGTPVTLSLNGGVFCANGVPLTIDENVSVTNGYIVGGKCVYQKGNVSSSDSHLVINGYADYVFGGGLAMGSGTISSMKNSNITLNGRAALVQGGGFAYESGQANVSGTANLTVGKNGLVDQALYGGGYADGLSSVANVGRVKLSDEGVVASTFERDGQSANGGTAVVGSQNQNSGGFIFPWWQRDPQQSEQSQQQPSQPAWPWFPGQPQQQNWPPQGGPNSGNGGYTNTIAIGVGSGQQAGTLNEAMNQIPMNAGVVTINLYGNIFQNEDVEIPANRGIMSLTIRPAGGSATVSWKDDSTAFFANGIPFVLERGVTFKNGIIYGGANVRNGQQSYLETTQMNLMGNVNRVAAGSKAYGNASTARVRNTNLTIGGTVAAWVYNGGAALYGGYATVDELAVLTLAQGGSAQQSIAGGPYAFGKGSQSTVKDAQISVAGSVVYAVYSGGYADQGGQATTDGTVTVTIESTGNVAQSVWYGGRAFKDAFVGVNSCGIKVFGRVGATIHNEGRASDGGSTQVRRMF